MAGTPNWTEIGSNVTYECDAGRSGRYMDVDKDKLNIKLKCLQSGSFEELEECPICLYESGKE